jgi:hypothetical protein
MQKCPFCQYENEDGALFCDQCKSDLAAVEAVAAAQADPAAPPAANLMQADTIQLAEDGATVAPVAAVAVDEPTISESAPAEGESPETHHAGAAAAAAAQSSEAPGGSDVTLPFTPPAAETAAAALPQGARPKLVVFRGQRVNAEYALYEGDNYIGRSDDKPVDVDLEDQEPADRIWSSRQHALITFENGRLAIEDLNSTNGTFVNRTRVHPGQKRPLQVNDVIQIGTVQMRVKV